MRLSVVMAVAAMGAISAPGSACADLTASKTFLDVAVGWAMPAAKADESRSKQGFFVGVQSGLISDSGVGPAVAGINLTSRN